MSWMKKLTLTEMKRESWMHMLVSTEETMLLIHFLHKYNIFIISINIPVEQLNNVLLPLPNRAMKRLPGNHDSCCSCHELVVASSFLSLQIQPFHTNAMDNHLSLVRHLHPHCTFKQGN